MFSVFVCSPSPYRLGLCLLVVVVCMCWLEKVRRTFEGCLFFSR